MDKPSAANRKFKFFYSKQFPILKILCFMDKPSATNEKKSIFYTTKSFRFFCFMEKSLQMILYICPRK